MADFVSDQFAAHITWLSREEMLPERIYTLRFGDTESIAQITDLVHVVSKDTGAHQAAKTLKMTETGYCKLALETPIAFETKEKTPDTGNFTIHDKFTQTLLGEGVLDFALRRAENIVWHEMNVNKEVRAKANNQKPCILWFTRIVRLRKVYRCRSA